MNLALDLDGVLFDFNQHFVRYARQKYPQLQCPNVDNSWPSTWDYLDEYLGKKETSKLWHSIIASPDWWAKCPAYWWSRDLLEEAYRASDKLYFITSRSGKHVQRQTYEALGDIGAEVIHSGAVIAVDSPEHKIPLINNLHIDYFVDDKKETVANALVQCPKTQVACWDQAWNREINFPVRLTCVEDFTKWTKS